MGPTDPFKAPFCGITEWKYRGRPSYQLAATASLRSSFTTSPDHEYPAERELGHSPRLLQPIAHPGAATLRGARRLALRIRARRLPAMGGTRDGQRRPGVFHHSHLPRTGAVGGHSTLPPRQDSQGKRVSPVLAETPSLLPVCASVS